MKKKTFSWMPRQPVLRAAMQSCWGLLLINWVFQGMRGMQSKELSFRVILEVLLAMAIYALLPDGSNAFLRIVISLVFAHTANWLFNGHLWVAVRYCPAYRRDPAALSRFLEETVARLRAISWLDEAVCIGSVGETGGIRSERSDIDLRLVFPHGSANWLRVNLLLLRLRLSALGRVIPLDLYAYNDVSALDRFRQDEGMRLIQDRLARVAIRYPGRVA